MGTRYFFRSPLPLARYFFRSPLPLARYFFRSPLPLARYLKIVLPLHAGLQLLKIWYSASATPLFHYRNFFRSAATSPQFRHSATAIFTVVHCMPQFAIPQYQYQYHPHYMIISSLWNILKNRPKNAEQRNSGSSILVIHYHWFAIFTSPPALARYFYQSAGQRTKIAVCPTLALTSVSEFWERSIPSSNNLCW